MIKINKLAFKTKINAGMSMNIIHAMLFQNTAPCFLTFYRSDQSILLFKFEIFVLNIYVASYAYL